MSWRSNWAAIRSCFSEDDNMQWMNCRIAFTPGTVSPCSPVPSAVTGDCVPILPSLSPSPLGPHVPVPRVIRLGVCESELALPTVCHVRPLSEPLLCVLGRHPTPGPFRVPETLDQCRWPKARCARFGEDYLRAKHLLHSSLSEQNCTVYRSRWKVIPFVN